MQLGWLLANNASVAARARAAPLGPIRLALVMPRRPPATSTPPIEATSASASCASGAERPDAAITARPSVTQNSMRARRRSF